MFIITCTTIRSDYLSFYKDCLISANKPHLWVVVWFQFIWVLLLWTINTLYSLVHRLWLIIIKYVKDQQYSSGIFREKFQCAFFLLIASRVSLQELVYSVLEFRCLCRPKCLGARNDIAHLVSAYSVFSDVATIHTYESLIHCKLLHAWSTRSF